MSFFGTRRQVDPAPRPAADAPPRLDPPQPPADVSQPVGFETVLGANSVMEGSLSSAANVRLDGTFTGVLEIGGNVLIGETAKITADVNARNISIAGAVRGNVTGKKVQLLRTGRVWGDIHAQALTTEEGAFIDGKITMVGHEFSPSPVSEPELEPEPELHLPEAPDEAEAEPEPAAEPEAAASVFGDDGATAPEADSTELLPVAPEADPEPPADEPEHPAES
ncbi:MAG: polymer-forming cytoskeletal protein [Anaerolineae bacterium]|nr:polymer-forming cytoskeletal protein [Anaerolineae bacterium]